MNSSKNNKCDNPLQYTLFWSVFEMGNPICVSVNSDLKLHKCGTQLQNTSFCPFYYGKSALCSCQLCLYIAQNNLCKCYPRLKTAQMLYPIVKQVSLCVLQLEISFVQVSTLTLNCINMLIHRKKLLFYCFVMDNPGCASFYSDLKLHKCCIPLQSTSFCAFNNRKSAVCMCQL